METKIKPCILHLINYAGNGGSEKYIKVLGGDFLIYNIKGDLVNYFEKEKTFQIEMKNLFDLKAAKKIAMFCKKNNVTVIHTHFARENYIAILSKLFGNKTKVVYTSHINLKNNLIWKILNKVFTRHNHAIVAVCTSVNNLLIKNGYPKKKIKIIYNGANISEKVNGDSIVTLARLSEEKGLFFLLNIAKKMPEQKFIIAGDGPLLEELKKAAPANVSLPGYMNSNEILKEAILYINTSTSEALSFGILEALAAGIPIIATNVGGNVDIINESEAGKLIEYNNVEDAKEKINYVLKHKIDFSENAIKAIKTTFSEEEMKRKTYELYL